jgi:hypothetical protein
MVESFLREHCDGQCPAKTKERADDNIFSQFSMFRLFDLTESKDGLCGNQKANSCWLTNQNQHERKEPF